MRQPTVLYTGSTYWNLGDDFVREGCRRLLTAAHGSEDISSLFFPFNLPRDNDKSPRREPLNLLNINTAPPVCDLIVVPGLAVGKELIDFHAWIHLHNLAHKTIFLGGMWENQYAAEYSAPGLQSYANLEASPLIVSRTRKMPAHIAKLPNVHTLACPSLVSTDRILLPQGDYIAVSIQLHEQIGGVDNHRVAPSVHYGALETIRRLVVTNPSARIKLVCHHQSEFEYFRDRFEDVFFSPWFQDYVDVYARARFVFSTRLHACFLANSLRVKACCCNDAPRPAEAIKENPFTIQVARPDPELFGKYLSEGRSPNEEVRIAEFQNGLRRDYVRLIRSVLEGHEI